MFILEKNANEAADRDCQSRVHLKGCKLLLATGIEELVGRWYTLAGTLTTVLSGPSKTSEVRSLSLHLTHLLYLLHPRKDRGHSRS